MITHRFRLVTTASLALFALYAGMHAPTLGDAWRSAFPLSDCTIAEEIVVTKGGSASGRMTPEAFDRIAQDAANLYYPRTNYVQTAPVPLAVFSPRDRVLLLEGDEPLRRLWKRPVACLAQTKLHSGRSAARLQTRRLVLVFYDSPRAFEKAWTYLSWCFFHQQHEDLRYTFEPAPLDRMVADGEGDRLARFLSGKTVTLYVHQSLDGCSPETCYGSARVGPHLAVACDSALARRLPELRIASPGDDALILANGVGREIGRFTHYVYGTDTSMFLLGTVSKSRRARAYLVVRSTPGADLACHRERAGNRR
jgi:hypothetical protein